MMGPGRMHGLEEEEGGWFAWPDGSMRMGKVVELCASVDDVDGGSLRGHHSTSIADVVVMLVVVVSIL